MLPARPSMCVPCVPFHANTQRSPVPMQTMGQPKHPRPNHDSLFTYPNPHGAPNTSSPRPGGPLLPIPNEGLPPCRPRFDCTLATLPSHIRSRLAVDTDLPLRGELQVRELPLRKPSAGLQALQDPSRGASVTMLLLLCLVQPGRERERAPWANSGVRVTYHSTSTYFTLQPPIRRISLSSLTPARPPPAPRAAVLGRPRITCVT